MDELALLAGSWEGIQGAGVYHEEWQVSGDGSLSGRAYLIAKGEIRNEELLTLKEEPDGIYYTAKVSHNEAPVRFRLTSAEGMVFVFENPAHDFPQKITYDMSVKDRLLAVIEAQKDGKRRAIEFRLKRSN